MPFEHVFLTENVQCHPYSVSVTLLYFTSLPFANICKSFGANYVTILHIPKWPKFKNFYRFSVSFFYVFYVIFGYISMESLRKGKNKVHTFISMH